MEARAARFDDRKISEQVARKILGKTGECYSEEELQDIVDRLYSMAEYGLWVKPDQRL